MIGTYLINGRNAEAAEESYVCLFITEGAAEVGEERLEAGQGILLCAEDAEAIRYPRACLRIDFSERELLRAFSERGIRADGDPFDLEELEELEQTARFFFEKKHVPLTGERALALLSLLLSYVERSTAEGETAATGYVRYAEEYIREHLSESIQVDAIAESLGISRGYLRNVFFSVHGMSPREYLTDARLRRAEELLREGGQSVTEVARAVGYEDVLQFSRIFKKHTGQSPSQARGEKRTAERPVREEKRAETPEEKKSQPESPKRKVDPVWLF